MSALGLGARAALGLGTDPRSALRRELKLRYKANEAVLTGSGTQALELAIHAVASPTRTTGPVALPAYGCFDIATAAVGARRPLALYDLDPDTLGPDPDSLRRAFACGATSAVVVSLYGLPPEWDAVSRCAADAGATLIEDAAQGAGGSWHGSPLGALAEVSVLSFGRGKGWTGGAGGALLLRGKCAVPEENDVRRSGGELRTWTAATAQWCLGRPTTYALPAAVPFLHLGETRYHPPASPRDLSRVSAAILQATHVEALKEATVRRARAARLSAALAECVGVRQVRPTPGGLAGWLRFPVRLRYGLAGCGRRDVAARLGIAAGYPAPLADLPAVRARLASPWREARWPGAETLVRELVTLPTHSLLTPADEAAITHLLCDCPT